MRLILILLIAVAMATSGCFGKDDDGGDGTPTVTTPMGTTPTTSTPTGTTPGGNDTNTTPTTPMKPAPKSLCSVSFDFSQNVQPGTPPTNVATAACGSVTTGYTKAVMNLTFTPATPAALTQGVSVALMDSAGTAAATCNGPTAGAQGALSVSCEGAVMAGDYTLQFNGIGPITVSGDVMIV